MLSKHFLELLLVVLVCLSLLQLNFGVPDEHKNKPSIALYLSLSVKLPTFDYLFDPAGILGLKIINNFVIKIFNKL